MSKDLVSLWPESIRADIQTPWRILHAQAEALGRQTKEILIGEITTIGDENGNPVLAFDIVAPELSGYRHRIMTVQYSWDNYYPAFVMADTLKKRVAPIQKMNSNLDMLMEVPKEKKDNQADNDQELIELVGRVLRSPSVVSAASSLISRVNEVLEEKEKRAQKETSTRTNDDSTEPDSE
jgi:hypothetical protein